MIPDIGQLTTDYQRALEVRRWLRNMDAASFDALAVADLDSARAAAELHVESAYDDLKQALLA